MQIDQRRARQQWQNTVNNAQGHIFEDNIKAACLWYREQGRAKIDKTPEAFRVKKKHPDGTFTGWFTAPAQPDYQGTLCGGRSIVFEAKYTTTGRLKRGVLTGEQIDALEDHARFGAVAAVCIGIQDKFFFIPWEVWRDMKQHFGRQYVTAADVEQYRIRFTGAVMFLDYIHVSAASIVFLAAEEIQAKERGGKHEEKTQSENDGPGHTANGV